MTALLGQGAAGLRIAKAGGYFRTGAVGRGACRRSIPSPRALGADARDRNPRSGAGARRRLCHHRGGGRGAASRPPARAARRFRPGRARPADRRRAGAGRGGRAGAEIPPLVSRRGTALFDEVDAILAPATPVHGAADRAEDASCSTAGRCRCGRISASIPSRSRSSACRSSRCPCRRSRGLPIGVQIIAAPWREDVALRVAHASRAAGHRSGAAAAGLTR